MQKQSSKTLYNYWNKLRGSRSAPDRRKIDPTKIRNALSNTFILELSDNDGCDFNFRLVGSHIYSIYCKELKRRSFNNLWHKKDQDAINTLIRAVTEDHAVAVSTFKGTTQTGAQANFEIILLPLHHNGNTVSRILGAISAVDDPFWLGTQPVMEQRITGLRLIWPDDIQARDISSQINSTETIQNDVMWRGFSDANLQNKPPLNHIPENYPTRAIAIPASVHGNNARRYAHLAVIDGGKS